MPRIYPDCRRAHLEGCRGVTSGRQTGPGGPFVHACEPCVRSDRNLAQHFDADLAGGDFAQRGHAGLVLASRSSGRGPGSACGRGRSRPAPSWKRFGILCRQSSTVMRAMGVLWESEQVRTRTDQFDEVKGARTPRLGRLRRWAAYLSRCAWTIAFRSKSAVSNKALIITKSKCRAWATSVRAFTQALGDHVRGVFAAARQALGPVPPSWAAG